MAALLYKDVFIVATGQFDKDLDRWIPIADVSWHLGERIGTKCWAGNHCFQSFLELRKSC
jgi:hypothetical protein